jgi:hypothetical protein
VNFVPRPAFPCLNGVYINTDEGAQLVAKAQRALDKKQYRRVLSLLGDPEMHFESAPLAERRMELVAIAHVRSGKISAGLASLSWLAQRKPKAPVVQAWYAEALFAAGDRAQALAILEKLERADLLPDEASRAVLAGLRAKKRPVIAGS